MAKDINSKQAGTFQQDSVHDPSIKVFKGRNYFPQHFFHPSTSRYGEVDPIMCFKAERGDVVPYRFVSDLHTYTMKSPMKSQINQYTACFKVPMQAIYPNNWDIMLPIPTKGDDVPDDCRAILNVPLLSSYIQQISLDRVVELHSLSAETIDDNLTVFVKSILLKELIYSSGSLFAKFNMHFSSEPFRISWYDNEEKVWNYDDTTHAPRSYDKYFDTYFVPWLQRILNDSSISDSDNNTFYITSDTSRIGNHFGRPYISFRRALELLRTGDWDIHYTGVVDSTLVGGLYVPTHFLEQGHAAEVNIEPIIAYQLSCAHFFTNSKVDFIYSAALWRDNMQSLLITGPLNFQNFIFNGVRYLYDVFSKKYFDGTLAYGAGNLSLYFSFYFNLLSYQRSLRYGDYFTGARPEPIAPGDINAPVIDSSVNALDITRKLQLTRLLNKVNISGSRMSEYLRALFGGEVPQAPKDVPVRLSLDKLSVSGFEVNNTGADQMDSDSPNITTTNLRLSESKYAFEASIDEPCWLIAVQYYDAVRIYARTIDRFAFHRDRYDDFIPDLQFIGDQEIMSKELNNSSDLQTNYAYNLRYMEYKNRYSYASGGFIENLPTWALITDNTDGNPAPSNIDPEYIRSSPSEFDRFYKSLQGYSLGSYFHFINFTANILDPHRQMVFTPEILA